ncbi:MAG: hypothetical protein ABF673_02255, partial [Acetobacter persici]
GCVLVCGFTGHGARVTSHGSLAQTPTVGGQSAVRTVGLDKKMGDAGLERCSELVQPGFYPRLPAV